MNFLALLGWSYDDKTTIMSRDELTERFSLERVQPSPATFDYKKLEWMNGVYIRELSPDEFSDRLVTYLRERGYDWDEELIRRSAPMVQEKISTLGAYPEFAGFLFHEVEPDPALLDEKLLVRAADVLEGVELFTADRIEQALRGLAEELELSPRKAFQPIRVAVTGSKISPGLFESLELLGKERSLARIRSRYQ
jgi:glutamyl-tRNA synthetase